MLDRSNLPLMIYIVHLFAIAAAAYAIWEFGNYSVLINSATQEIEQFTGTGYLFLGLISIYIHVIDFLYKTTWFKDKLNLLKIVTVALVLIMLFVIPRVYDSKVESMLTENGYQLCKFEAGRSRVSKAIWYKGTECPSVSEIEAIDNYAF